MSNIDSVLSSVLSDEGLMDKIKGIVKSHDGDTSSSLEEVISAISPKLQGENIIDEKSKADKIIDTGTNEISQNKLLLSLSKSISKNVGLLIALKPYLSKERCQMIDGIVKISKLADTLKLLEGGL